MDLIYFINLIYVMGKRKKNHKVNPETLADKIRRDSEIKNFGKIISLRPGKVMKSKKDYKRKWKLSDEIRKDF